MALEYKIVRLGQRSAPAIFETDYENDVLVWFDKNQPDPSALEVYIHEQGGSASKYVTLEQFIKDTQKLPTSVNHPPHYTFYAGVEVIDLTEQMNFNRGNAVKYIARAGLKDPSKEAEDLQKALWYIKREIARIQKQETP